MIKNLIFVIMVAFALSGVAAQVEVFSIPSLGMKKEFAVTVILPDAYDGKKAFKQIYLLHGAGGNSTTWHKKIAKLEPYADDLQRLIICPTAGRQSWYNHHNKSEDYIIKEVIPAIDKKYKTLNDRWMTGFSMGGFGALRLGFKYPELFSMFGGQSACIVPSKWTHKWGIKKSMGPGAKSGADDLFTPAMLKSLKKDKRPISLLCGKQDFFYKENLKAYEDLKKVRPDVLWLDMKGGHKGKYWRVSLKETLKFFAAQEKKK